MNVKVIVEFKGLKIEMDLKEAEDLYCILEKIVGGRKESNVFYPVCPHPRPWWEVSPWYRWTTTAVTNGTTGEMTYGVQHHG
jgi:hypothetical protein